MREIVILGSTGSIGIQALELIAAYPEEFRVIGLSAGSANLPLLIEQARKFGLPIIGTTAGKDAVSALVGATPKFAVINGERASAEIASITCDIVLNGITGSIGLGPTLAALAAGNRVALANKESLVAGGDLVMAYGRDRILPVDSEHSALFQCFLAGKASEIRRAILTASGGAFRDRQDFENISMADALSHPTWRMGPVVTVNSATLVNKGLEIIEAHHLFGLPYSQIEAVIHPQSIIHSMVEFIDGSTIAQASPPNMKGPIAYALSYPDRISRATPAIDWTKQHSWDFAPIDSARFPAVALARYVGEIGGAAPAIFNAANECAVSAFLNQELKFASIVKVVSAVVDALASSAKSALRDLHDVNDIENDARRLATEQIREIA